MLDCSIKWVSKRSNIAVLIYTRKVLKINIAYKHGPQLRYKHHSFRFLKIFVHSSIYHISQNSNHFKKILKSETHWTLVHVIKYIFIHNQKKKDVQGINSYRVKMSTWNRPTGKPSVDSYRDSVSGSWGSSSHTRWI